MTSHSNEGPSIMDARDLRDHYERHSTADSEAPGGSPAFQRAIEAVAAFGRADPEMRRRMMEQIDAALAAEVLHADRQSS